MGWNPVPDQSHEERTHQTKSMFESGEVGGFRVVDDAIDDCTYMYDQLQPPSRTW